MQNNKFIFIVKNIKRVLQNKRIRQRGRRSYNYNQYPETKQYDQPETNYKEGSFISELQKDQVVENPNPKPTYDKISKPVMPVPKVDDPMDLESAAVVKQANSMENESKFIYLRSNYIFRNNKKKSVKREIYGKQKV